MCTATNKRVAEDEQPRRRAFEAKTHMTLAAVRPVRVLVAKRRLLQFIARTLQWILYFARTTTLVVGDCDDTSDATRQSCSAARGTGRTSVWLKGGLAGDKTERAPSTRAQIERQEYVGKLDAASRRACRVFDEQPKVSNGRSRAARTIGP